MKKKGCHLPSQSRYPSIERCDLVKWMLHVRSSAVEHQNCWMYHWAAQVQRRDLERWFPGGAFSHWYMSRPASFRYEQGELDRGLCGEHPGTQLLQWRRRQDTRICKPVAGCEWSLRLDSDSCIYRGQFDPLARDPTIMQPRLGAISETAVYFTLEFRIYLLVCIKWIRCEFVLLHVVYKL